VFLDERQAFFSAAFDMIKLRRKYPHLLATKEWNAHEDTIEFIKSKQNLWPQEDDDEE
jgi:hypothetical protein